MRLASDPCSHYNNIFRIDLQSSKPVSRLAQEVVEAIESDPMHGPRQDRERNAIGIEYEELLENCLNELGKWLACWRVILLVSCVFIRTSYISTCHTFKMCHSRVNRHYENEGLRGRRMFSCHVQWESA